MKNVFFLIGFLLMLNVGFGQTKVSTSVIVNFHKNPKNAVEMQEDKPCTYRPAEPKPLAPQPILASTQSSHTTKQEIFSETELALASKNIKR